MCFYMIHKMKFTYEELQAQESFQVQDLTIQCQVIDLYNFLYCLWQLPIVVEMKTNAKKEKTHKHTKFSQKTEWLN